MFQMSFNRFLNCCHHFFASIQIEYKRNLCQREQIEYQKSTMICISRLDYTLSNITIINKQCLL